MPDAALVFADATRAHRDVMVAMFRDACRRGDALPFDEDTPDALIEAMWLADGIHAHVALIDGAVVGMYKINANYPGRAAHVGSGTYIVRADMQGRGIGGAMLRESLRQAAALGFRFMQFNFVVATNAPAVELYRKHGFGVVGTLPQAFRHKDLGYVDAYVMSRPIDT